MGKPVYLYFNVRARGELPRLVAAVGKIDYVDKRIDISEWPGHYKSEAPFGQVPTLEVDGHLYAQKLAISLYFARQVGLYPTSGSPLEILKYDHALQYTEEVLEAIVLANAENYIFKKPERLATLKEQGLAQRVPFLEKLLIENGTGYFVGNKLSIVDLSAFDVTEHVVDLLGKPFLDSFPQLKAHYERIGQIEEIKKYLASRPAEKFPGL